MLRKLLTLMAFVLLGANGAVADETMERIKSDGKITVATEAAFKPFEYVEDGKIVGFVSDLLTEVLKDLGVKVEQRDLPFQGSLAGLAAGQVVIAQTFKVFEVWAIVGALYLVLILSILAVAKRLERGLSWSEHT